MREQCRLAGVARSGLYYPPPQESAENLELMRRLDEQYTRTPFYGVLRMTEWLRKQGHEVNPKRVRRLLRQMGLEAIYARPRLSIAAPGHRIYPYRLRGLPIVRPNQVWGTDITYIRMRHGFVYLVAVMDWFSRYVLAWEVSVTLDVSFCITALQWALSQGQPEIFNSDQGSQFTSELFTSFLLARGIDISMDGRGRAMDNIFVERLWRTVKYEEVYLNDYENVRQAIDRLREFFHFYNQERLHQSLAYRTPADIYFGKEPKASGIRKMAMVMVGERADRRL
jgi:putative transposase